MKTDLTESQCFTLDEHIKKSSEIKNLFKNGKRVSIFGAKLFYLPNDLGYNRIAFPLSRGFGNAVQRNRAKRFSRETYRINKTHLNTGFDIILLIYPDSEKKDSFSTRCVQFRTLCKKAGLIRQ